MKHIVVYRALQQKQLDFLRKHCQVSYHPDVTEKNEEFLQSLKTANGLFGAGMKITEDLLSMAKNLQVVSNFSAGYDNLDLNLLTKKGIIATHAPDALTDTVADLIFTLMLTTARRVSELDLFIRKGNWRRVIDEDYLGTDVHHRNIGIIGLGRIGRKLAKRAKGFDMKIYYYKRSRNIEAEEKYEATYCQNLDHLLRVCDFICITVPLTKETRHMISYRELNLMKQSAILVNVARGAIIHEESLISALKNGDILGAGLDVFEQEPIDSTSELLNLKNVVLTPHIGSATLKTRELMVEQGINNLLAALNGERPENILNEEVFKQQTHRDL